MVRDASLRPVHKAPGTFNCIPAYTHMYMSGM